MNRTAVRASVIVPSRGGAQRLPRLVEALATQRRAPRFEVCVVLDGDIDASTTVLEGLAAQHPQLDLHWVVFEENRGRAAALNAGFAATTGRVVIRCDDDLAPEEDYVRAHVARHAGTARLGVVGLYRNIYPSTPYARAYGRTHDQRFRTQAYAASPGQRWRYWAGNVSVLREVWQEIGDYDAAFRRYGWEDIDFGYRLHRAGVDIVLAPELETAHHVAAVTTRIRSRRALHAGASRQIFLGTHGAEALGGEQPPGGLWGAAVRLAAAVSTERSLGVAGGLTDRVIDAVPPPIAEKLVALQVEAAAEAGRRWPRRARGEF